MYPFTEEEKHYRFDAHIDTDFLYKKSKPSVPRSVAVWFEANKKNIGAALLRLGAEGMASSQGDKGEVIRWVGNPDNDPMKTLNDMYRDYTFY